MNEAIIDIKNLNRDYLLKNGFFETKKVINALKNINIQINKGEVFGILGPNGAGKSTLMKILSTILLQSSGDVNILGYNVKNDENQIRSKINLITGSERNLYWRLSAKENLSYFADLYKVKSKEIKINELLELVGLTSRANDKVETFSKGMKQRLQIARGLINDPDIILLDEPTLGLDIVTAKELRILIKNLSKKGKTIIFTTHYMEEAEEVCDRIAFIKNGKINRVDSIEDLKKIFTYKYILKVILNEQIDLNQLFINDNQDILIEKTEKGYQIKIYTSDLYLALNRMIKNISESYIFNMEIKNVTVEDIYLKILGEKNEK